MHENTNNFSVNTHFSLAWKRLSQSALSLILLNIIIYSVSIVLLVIISVAAGITTIFNEETIGALKSLFEGNSEAFSQIPASYFTTIGLMIFVYIIISIVISSILQGATILAVSKSHEKPAIGSLISEGFNSALKVFILSFITSLMLFGAYSLFIIPGLAITFFLSFAVFELVINKKGIFSSIKSSVNLVGEEVGLVIGRILLIWLIYFLSGIFFSLLSEIEELVLYVVLIQMVVNITLNWFSFTYLIVLYEHLKIKYPSPKQVSTVWIWIVSVLGWILFGIFVLVIIIFISQIPSDDRNGMFNENSDLSHDVSFENYAPSNCGLSVPIPDTYKTNEEGTYHWIYEERLLDQNSFSSLLSDVDDSTIVVGGFLEFKTDAERYDDIEKSYGSRRGLNIICIENSYGYSLEEFVEHSLENEDFTIEANDLYTYGDVLTQFVTVEGLFDGDYYIDRRNLAVHEDGSRLLYIKIWQSSNESPFDFEFQQDLEAILNNLSYRSVGKNLDPSDISNSTSATSSEKTAQQASCTSYNIREGEFASNKCYSQTDYNDLIYYLQRYNSSASSYNGAIASMNITCNGSDFFKDNCEEDTRQKAEAEKNMAEYKNTINLIISRGK